MEMESSEASEILIIKRKGVRENRHMGRLRASGPSWQLASLLWGISSMFPLTGHRALPGSESDWFISGSSQMCAPHIAKMESHEEAYR